MILWKLRNPMICCLQAREPAKPVVQFNMIPKAQEPRQGRRQATRLREQIHASSAFLFYSGPQ